MYAYLSWMYAVGTDMWTVTYCWVCLCHQHTCRNIQTPTHTRTQTHTHTHTHTHTAMEKKDGDYETGPVMCMAASDI
jgi:hypothetical protein